ncbi:hypothetical protein DIPPA_32418 [Diplonema papillatum]|nr:hypothetical protein DIPPA_32418 [Diplonema papillatum]
MAMRRCRTLLAYKWRWDLGDWAVAGVHHVDSFGAYKGGGKTSRAMIAGGAFQTYRSTYQANHTPHFKARNNMMGAEYDRRLFDEHRGNHIAVPVTPRRLTREQLEESEVVARRNAARRAHASSVPLVPFYLESNWKARFSRQYDKIQAEEEISSQIYRSLPPAAQQKIDEEKKLLK